MKKNKNSNILKKLIISFLMLVILINTFMSNKVEAVFGIDLDEVAKKAVSNIGIILYKAEYKILKFADKIFCDDAHQSDEQIYISPETIIKGKFSLLNANIFENIQPGNSDYYDSGDSGGINGRIVVGRNNLRKTISGWYYALRNLALVALLSILVYVGIRMVLTSVSQDKAKYKGMLVDWLVAICLLFVLHFIMIVTLNVTSTITNAIGTKGNNLNLLQKPSEIITGVLGSGYDTMEWTDPDDGEVYEREDVFVQELIIFVIILYTGIFLWKYLKRMITIVFLVLLAPISCITYPIDKIGDGKAQAFNTWLQEFIYNVIIQPFHLLIYIVLVSSAIDLANSNIIYTICCFSAIIPAEKFIKQMFGFRDQLGSPLGTFAGGALFSKVLDSFKSGKATSDGGKGGNSGGSKDDEDRELPPNNKEIDEPEDVYSDDGSDGLDDPSGSDNPDESTPELESSSEGQEGITDGSDENVEGDPNDTGEDGSDNAIDGESDEIGEENETPEENEASEGDEDENIAEDGQGEGGQPNANDSANEEKKKKNGRLTRVGRKAKKRFNRHLQKTYGATTAAGVAKGVGIRALKATGRGVYKAGKGVVRGTIKGATTLGLGLAAGTMSMMLGGKFSSGAVTGAALGAKIGGGITNQLDKVTSGVEKFATNTARDFMYSDEQLDERDFKKKDYNIRQAQNNFAFRHDGRQPNGKELKEELDKMYQMKQHGIDEDYFNRTLGQYEDYLEDGMDEKDAFDTAMSSAIDAQEYKAADFRDPKKVAQLYEEKMAALRNSAEMRGKKLDERKASERVSKVLLGAANMKGVKGVKIPTINTNPRIPSQSSEKIRIKIGSEVTDKIAEGYKDESDLIQSIAESARQSISGTATQEKIDVAVEAEIGKFEKYLNNKDAQSAVANLNGNARNHEMAMRYNVKLKHGIKDEKAISDIRDLEGKLGRKNTELADKLSREISSPRFKSSGRNKEDLVKEVTNQITEKTTEAVNGNINNTAESVVDLAGKYSGINF